MTNTKRKFLLPPPSTNGMQITTTNTTSLDLNIDIIITKRLGLHLIEVEFGTFCWILNLETLPGIGVDHFS